MEKLGKKTIVEQSTQNEWKRVSTEKGKELEGKPNEWEVKKENGLYYARKKTSGTTPSPSPSPNTTPSPTPTPTKKTSPYKRCENAPLQTKYCVSELIKKVQICLKEAGHDLGTTGVQRDGVDGYWGDKTDAALRTYGFGSGIDKQAVEVICSTVDRIKRERVQKQLKDKADQEYQQKYGGMERASEVDYLYFGGENAGGGDEEASGEGMEGETLFFN
jgi:hypothetical protein